MSKLKSSVTQVFFFIAALLPLPAIGHMWMVYPISRPSKADINCGVRTVPVTTIINGTEQCMAEGQPDGCYPTYNCGVCGDSISLPVPRPREYGFPNSSYLDPRLPTAVYREGSTFPVLGCVQNPHLGYYQYRICSDVRNESLPDIYDAQSCFDQNLLNFTTAYDAYNESRRNPYIPNEVDVLAAGYPGYPGMYNCYGYLSTAMAELPPGLYGDHLSIQLNYISQMFNWPVSMTWGVPWNWTDNPPKVWQRQVFRSCGDIRILRNNDFSMLQNKKTSLFLSASPNSYPANTSSCDSSYQTVATPQMSLIPSTTWANLFTTNGTILYKASNLCLDSFAATLNPGVPIGPYTCNGGSNQNWWFLAINSSYFQIRNQKSGLCLTSQANNTIIQDTCPESVGNTPDIQTWSFYNSTDYGFNFLQQSNTSLYLSANDQALHNPGSFFQAFLAEYQPIPVSLPDPLSMMGTLPWASFYGTNGSIVFESNGLCLGVMDARTSDGAWIGHYQCQNYINQRWWFNQTAQGTEYFQLVNAYTGLCLSTQLDGTTVQNNCNSADDSQIWSLFESTSYCVDVFIVSDPLHSN